MTPAELVASRKHVLLDFDGPVCAVFGTLTDRVVADRLRALLDVDLPAEIAESDDPFDVLRHAATLGADTAATVEREFRRLEVEAVATAPPTPGAADTIRALVDAGHTVTIVSNNSEQAVRRFLEQRGLAGLVNGVSARTFADPGSLKPNPFLLEQAINSAGLDRGECVMLGDSVSDIEAARSAGTDAIAYANKPSKHLRLQQAHPDAIITHMAQLISG